MNLEQEILLKKYADAVMTAPAHLHLTSERDSQLFWNRHITDAIQINDHIPLLYKEEALKVIDVGSGNGIPGIPISILNPAWQVDLLDSDNKKSLFIDTFINIIALKNAHMITSRAEISAQAGLRASYDIAIARALSKLRVSLELCAGFLKVGGVLIVPHGTSWKEELGQDLSILDLLGLSEPEVLEYSVGEANFVLLLFKKKAETPAKYPRRDGMPKKRPL